ncbi:GNAT family N-acetyltransferase [Lactobacillus sp. PV034]|uniref:GNAT family N-acetyltransferase n=1 Tax=Lactobacillus sp. PV034 TaxID=2594495 RepID=UPI00224076A9|nr:GNAT family N-acetyltransferase [Lactobacillus sp. PV034]QNQ80702.1 N-acetyltransferase [Lactobacillus sp. PV034]
MIREAKLDDFKYVFPILNQIFDEMDLETIKQIPEEQFYQLMELGFRDPKFTFGYKHIWVAADNRDKPIGILDMYSYEDQEAGSHDEIKKYQPQLGISKDFTIFTDDEALVNEWYIDSLAVDPKFWGQGIATSLLSIVPKVAAAHGYKLISLNVDKENTRAKRLYDHLNFKTVSEMTIGDRVYDHMILQ